jgi:iron complex transport system ATP-binding protein
VIALEGVSAGFGERRVLEDVSFSVGRGEFVGLLGPNGSGKTTLLKLVARLLAPASGRVLVGGRDVATLPRRELARLVAGVWQRPALSFGFTVKQLVLLGRTPHVPPLGWEGAHDLEAAERAMDETGTTHLSARVAATLSAGELQRVFIASALAQDTVVLLLDEPTSFLDLRQAARLSSLLARLVASGLTVLCASHDLALLKRHADRIVLLQGGRATTREPEAALSRECLTETFEVPAEEWYA